MLLRFLKDFSGIFIAIAVLVCMTLILSVNVSAESGYVWLPYCEVENPDANYVHNDGLTVTYGVYGNSSWMAVDDPVKCFYLSNGNVVVVSNIQTSYYVYAYGASAYERSITTYDTVNALYYAMQGFSYIRSINPDVPIYSNLAEGLAACNDGSWSGPIPPHEPEYNYDNSLGALKNIQFKQIAQGTDGFVSVTYDQYTTTNVDLSQNGYGVMSKLVVKDTYSSDKVFSEPNYIMDPIGGFYVEVDSSGNFRYDKLLPDLFNGGGGHSFDYPEGGSSSGNSEEIYPGKTLYDLFLWPYYYDGSDYTYGLGQLIENIKYDRIGQQMYTIEDPEEVDPDQNLNVTRIIERRIELENNETYYDIDNIENIVEIYNYTYVDNSGDTITNNDFSNVDNSTTNIYNYENNYITENQWSSDVDPTDILSIIKHLLNWVANDFLVKSGLFNYLPSWSLGLASGILAALATLLTFKIIRGS